MLGIAVATANPAFAQRTEPVGVQSPRAPASDSAFALTTSMDTIADSLKKPPISARRAFFLSVLMPGYAQARLDRPTASMLFAMMEVWSLGMLRKASQDLREAKGASRDSIYIGLPTDPVTGNPTSNGYILPRFTVDRVNARRTHYEDWVAALITNHLLAGADAYVAANLWDFHANVTVDPDTKSTKVGASKSF